GLRVHPGHPGGDRDDQHLRVVGGDLGEQELGAHHASPPKSGRAWLPRNSCRRTVSSMTPRLGAGAFSANSSSALRASGVSAVGTSTSSVTSRSPTPPSRRGTPRLRTRRVRPLGVPAATRTV